jgi:hypothetical protein
MMRISRLPSVPGQLGDEDRRLALVGASLRRRKAVVRFA